MKIERNQNKYLFLENLDCHEPDAWIKTKGLLIELPSANGMCSMEILFAGIIPVVTEKFELDYRNKSKILSLS